MTAARAAPRRHLSVNSSGIKVDGVAPRGLDETKQKSKFTTCFPAPLRSAKRHISSALRHQAVGAVLPVNGFERGGGV